MSKNLEILKISELYEWDDNDMPDSAYPICYHDIFKSQKTDAKLQQNIVWQKYYTLNRATKTIIWNSEIARYAYPRHNKRKL